MLLRKVNYYCKNRILLFVVVLMAFMEGSACAQLVVNNTQTPQQLVQNVLLGGGVTVSNITYTGASIATGYFDGTNSNIGLSSGILMTNGDINNAVGPNNTSSASTDNSLPGDPDLDIIAGSTTYDASVLEFDFVPSSDTVQFRYVFGSEEYPEYVGSYNDAFGFFISGPGISGSYSNNAENIALIPNTTTPVTINNVNDGTSDTGPCTNCTYYVDNGDGSGMGTDPVPDGQTVQYDGFTKVLTATAVVQCGQTYHIKLAIADAGDGVFDSGVFLEAGSFKSNSNVNITASVDFGVNDSTLYEGCGAAVLNFNRDSSQAGQPLTVMLSTSGTATNGTDYTQLPDSIYFPAGDTSQTITIQTIKDNIPEGTESLILTFSIPSACGTPITKTMTFYIKDETPLSLLPTGKDTLCTGDSTTLLGSATGGLPKYHYSWSDGVNDSITTVYPTATTTYTLSVTDSCGNTADTSYTVYVSKPNAAFSDEVSSFESSATFVNQSTGANSYYWDFGDNTTSTQSDPTHDYFNPSGGSMTYHVMLIATDQNGCTDTTYNDVNIIEDLYFYTPNTFSPNSDGQNDIFRAYGAGIATFSMKIYNRWGALIFQSDNIDEGWDGTIHGHPAQEDTYIAVFDVTGLNRKTIHKITRVNLLR